MRSPWVVIFSLLLLAGCTTNEQAPLPQPGAEAVGNGGANKAQAPINDPEKKAASPEEEKQPALPAAKTKEQETKPFWFEGKFSSLVFSPDNQTIAAGGWFWDAKTGKPLRRWPFSASCLTYSPDGKLLLFGNRYEIGLWDPERQKMLWREKEPAEAVTFSADGIRFARSISVHSTDGNFWITDTGSKKEVKEIRSHGNLRSAKGVALSSDGKYLAGQMGPVVRIWEVDSGKFLGNLGSKRGKVFLGEIDGIGNGEFHAPSTVFYSPDGKYLASAVGNDTADKQIFTLWDWPSTKVVWEFPRENTMSKLIGFTPDSKYVVFGGTNQYLGAEEEREKLSWQDQNKKSSSVQIREVATGKIVPKFLGYNRQFHHAALSRDGKKLVVAWENPGTTWEILDLEKDQTPPKR